MITSPDVVCSPLQEGGVLFDLATKQYFALNSTGVLVWQYLEDGGTLDALRSALSASRSYDERNGDFGLQSFASALSEHGLATEAADAGSNASAPPPLPSSWVAPEVTPHGRPLSQVILSPFDPTVPIPE